MNREIKFRVWDAESERMCRVTALYGDLIQAESGEQVIELIREESPLMRFTGVKDKNGTDVYEGDVVEYSYRRDQHEAPRTFQESIEYDREGDMQGFRFLFDMNPVVVGNIYEGLVSPAPDSNSDRGKGDEIVNEQAASMA